jgi:hypothetical protein
MHRRHVLLLLGLSACSAPAAPTEMPPKASPTAPRNSAPNARPKDFAFTYTWREGTLPPPFHYSYIVEVKANGNGEVRYTPDYASPNTPTWVMPFASTPAQLDAFFALTREKGLYATVWKEPNPPPIGGSSSSLKVVADGKTFDVPSFVIESQSAAKTALSDAAKGMVDAQIWTDLTRMRDQYRKTPRG